MNKCIYIIARTEKGKIVKIGFLLGFKDGFALVLCQGKTIQIEPSELFYTIEEALKYLKYF